MVDFPKHFNTKEDYLNMDKLAHEKMKPVFQSMLDDRKEWFYVHDVEKGTGVSDSAHKVEEQHHEDGAATYAQYELRDNPAADFFKYGFTEEEVLKLMKM